MSSFKLIGGSGGDASSSAQLKPGMYNNAGLSASDYALLSQFGISNTGFVAGHTQYPDIEHYLDSLTGNLDSALTKMAPLQNTAGFDSGTFQKDSATRAALNKLRLQYTLQNSGNALATDPTIVQLKGLLQSSDPSVQAALRQVGDPDVSVLSDPNAAQQYIKQVNDAVTAAQAQTTAAAAAAATTAQNAADTAQLTQTTNDQFVAADNDYQAALQTAGSTFDATTAAQQAQRQSDSAALSRGLGFGATVTAAGGAEGLADTQATADRAATLSDARQTAAATLASTYEQALSTNVAGTSLSSEQQAQVHAQAADQLAATIQQEFASLSVEQQSQLAGVQNLLAQYQNDTLSAEQKQSLLGKIIQGVLGAGGAVAGAFLGGAGGAVAGSAAGNAAGSAIGAAA